MVVLGRLTDVYGIFSLNGKLFCFWSYCAGFLCGSIISIKVSKNEKNWVINLKKWGFIYNPSYAQKHIRKCYYSKFYESIPKSTPMILIFLGDFNGIKNLRISAPYIWELTKFEKSRFFKNDNKNFWISKFFFSQIEGPIGSKVPQKKFCTHFTHLLTMGI